MPTDAFRQSEKGLRLRLLDLAKIQLYRGVTTEDRDDDFDPGARFVHLFHDAAIGPERTCVHADHVTLEYCEAMAPDFVSQQLSGILLDFAQAGDVGERLLCKRSMTSFARSPRNRPTADGASPREGRRFDF